MRKIDRSGVDPPSILQEPYSRGRNKGKTELDLVSEHRNANGDHRNFEFRRYKEDDVKAALEVLFARKCAYCESAYDIVQPVDVEHFRPKGSVAENEGHDGYWWLAMDWNNLLPSCIDCNRRRTQVRYQTDISAIGATVTLPQATSDLSGKQDSFPVQDEASRWTTPAAQAADADGDEGRLLIDPTRDDPCEHIAFWIEPSNLLGLVYPKHGNGRRSNQASRKGATSIATFGLNRTGLVQARTRLLRDLEFLYRMSLSLGQIVEELEERLNDTANGSGEQEFNRRIAAKLRTLRQDALDKIREMAQPDAPYCETARAWIRTRLSAGGRPTDGQNP